MILFSISIIFIAYTQKLAKPFRVRRREYNILITKKFVNILMSKFEILQNYKHSQETGYIEIQYNHILDENKKIRTFNI